MSDPCFHFLGWGGSQPSNHVEPVALSKPGTIKVPASPVCKDCPEKKTGRALKTRVFKQPNMIVTACCCD